MININGNNKILPRAFYARPTILVAIDLLGKTLLHNIPKGKVAGKIVEAEAYLGEIDLACHAFYGKTQRSKIFWGNSGIAYVFINYGIHYCFNAITEEPNVAGCVLIRALEPIEGISIMKENRKTDDLLSLTNGPGKLTQALGITLKNNGVDLTQEDLLILDNGENDFDIIVTSRIGISKAKNEPLRFYINNNPFVSYRNRMTKLFEGTSNIIKEAFSNGTISVSLNRKNLPVQLCFHEEKE
jgi:DNA-3-methyladenine glycosylase